MKIIIFIVSIISLVVFVLIIGNVILNLRFSKQVKELFSFSKNISEKTFTSKQLFGLPEPVQRYFKHVLIDGQPYISFIRMTHDGKFKAGADKKWTDITGEQYATTERPGFIWKGRTATFQARDLYIGNKGGLTVSLLSLVTVVNATGEAYDQGELLRWLGESVLYPTNLLPSERLQWSEIDRHSARLTFNYEGLSLFYIVSFNDTGEIVQLETKRFMDEKRLETWIIKLNNYKDINGVLVPTTFEVLWRLKEGDLSYAKFRMKKVEYNRAEKF